MPVIFNLSFWSFHFCLCIVSIPPGSLECLPRQELEQRLMSSMIMVEALVQQLTAARTHGCAAAPAPSDLRDKLVQTDHTELNQVERYFSPIFL